MNPVLGKSGIKSFESCVTVDSDTVSWHPDYGIRVSFLEDTCDSMVLVPGSVEIRNCVLPGLQAEPEQLFPLRAAISLSWVCRDISTTVEADSMWHWQTGIEIVKCADAVLECNAIQDNLVGIYYEAIEGGPQEPVVLNKNRIKSNYLYGLEIQDADALVMNGSVGENTITLQAVEPEHDPDFIWIDDEDPFDATEQAWLDASGDIITNPAVVAMEISGPGAMDVDVDPLLEVEPESCLPSSTKERRRAGTARDLDPHREIEPSQPELPREFALYSGRPNPARGAVTIAFDVPAAYGGDVEVTVYDIAGRVVRTVKRGNVRPGRYRELWSGEMDSGGRVATGIYFVRVEAKGFTATRKIVFLR